MHATKECRRRFAIGSSLLVKMNGKICDSLTFRGIDEILPLAAVSSSIKINLTPVQLTGWNFSSVCSYWNIPKVTWWIPSVMSCHRLLFLYSQRRVCANNQNPHCISVLSLWRESTHMLTTALKFSTVLSSSTLLLVTNFLTFYIFVDSMWVISVEI